MIADEQGLALFRFLGEGEVLGHSKAELEIGEDALEVSDFEVTRL